MPRIKISSVVSCSSQDPRYPACNLTKWPCQKWLCQPSDAKQSRAEVTLKLLDSCIISAIDIGNHGSFSVEVQVGRGDKFYETLLNPTTFMSVADSRNSANVSQVKMFKSEQFDSATRNGAWDTIKIICTQPYRKDKVFGLAILKLMSDSVSLDLTPHKAPSRSVDDFIKQHRQPSSTKESPQEKWFNGMRQQSLKQITNTGQRSSSNRGLNMVMASSKTPTYKTPLVQEMLNKKSSPTDMRRPTFMGSVRTFFRQLDFRNIDPLNTKVSDLRNKFEKLKARKLSSDEKKLFKTFALDYCEGQFGDGRKATQRHTDAAVKGTPSVDTQTLKLSKELGAQILESPKEQTTPKLQLNNRFGKRTPNSSSSSLAEKNDYPSSSRSNFLEANGANSLMDSNSRLSPSTSNSMTCSPISPAANLQPVDTLHAFSPLSGTTQLAVDTTCSNLAVYDEDFQEEISPVLQLHSPTDFGKTTLHSQSGLTASNPAAKASDIGASASTCPPPRAKSATKLNFSAVTAKASSSENLSTSSRAPSVSRRSSALQANAHSTPRLEIRPAVKKRTLSDLLDEDDDDLLLPVSKTPTLSAGNGSATSGTKSQLTLEDLLSSDDEDDPVKDVAKHDNGRSGETCTSFPPTAKQAQCVIVLSDDEDELLDLTIDENAPAASTTSHTQEMTTPGTMQCPICMKHFQLCEIEAHASDCVILLD